MSILTKLREFFATASAARELSQKSILSQFRELVALRFGAGKLGLSEYYKFGLFDDQRWTMQQKREFAGWRVEGEYGRKLNPRSWNVLTGDKLVARAAFVGFNLPVPELKAVFQPFNRTVADVKVLTSENELADYLRREISYPFFSKPAHGAFGRNSVAVVGYEADSDRVQLSSGETVSMPEYVKACYPLKDVLPWEGGFLFQERLMPDPYIAERVGDTVSGLRMVYLQPDEGPVLLRCVWKIPVGKSMTDNFRLGTSGNLIADIDPATGEVKRVLSGVGLAYGEASVHPDTGSSFEGMAIPGWDRYLEVGRLATAAFPGIRLQHWDVAITDRGPVILELNTFGDFDLPQLASGRGLLAADFLGPIEKLAATYPTYQGKGDY